jgi:uncharacterized membrane protein YdjX (TVP38/TMEM64 family)
MRRETLNRAAMAAAFLALVYALHAVPVADKVVAVVAWAQANPVPGAFAYLAIVVPATVLFVPGSVSMLVAGFVFGFATGTLVAVAGIVAGAQCAFLLGRFVARDWVAARVGKSRRLTAIENGLREEAFVIIALTRVSLVMPFNLLNYAYSITSVNGGVYFLATTVGMLLPIALYVYLGTVANDIGQILAGTATPGGFGYVLAAAGIVAIALLTWIMHRAANRALRRHLPSLESDNA